MKRVLCIVCILIFCSFSPAVFADDTAERLKKLEDTVQNQSKTIEEQQNTIDSLKENISKQKNQVPLEKDQVPQQTDQELQQKVQELNEKVDQVVETQKKEIPSIFNPSIGFVGETIFSYRSQGSAETGSDRPGGYDIFQRSMELNAAASVDPFTKGYVVVNASADLVTGESTLTVEEAAIQTTSLPGNLEVKAGRFFGEFGRLGYIHDHELPFVNRPLVLAQYIGGESRTDGLQINWLVPVEHYISLTLGVGDQFGGDNPPNFVGDFRHGSELNYWGRLSTYYDLTPDISLEPGISGLWNPSTIAQWAPVPSNPPLPTVDGNTFIERERRLVGVDVVLSWKPLRNNQFQTVTWGTEVLYSDNRYDVTDSSGNALPSRSVGSYGMYSYLTYKFHRQWTTGIQYEWMEDIQNNQARTSAYSANITWALSHWNQLRLQYTYTDPNTATGLRSDNAVYLQWAWIIGSHAHGWQQR
jgi:cell division protein FtsB